MMNNIRFHLELESSLACTPDDAHWQEQLILPGTMVRGALAALYLRVHGDADERFKRIFVDTHNVFPFLFPADDSGSPRAFAPRTTIACKRREKEHGVRSKLMDEMSANVHSTCKTCNQDLRPYSGFLGDAPVGLELTYPGHTAIHRKTGTAAPGNFFRELLITATKRNGRPDFAGTGFLDSESIEVLRELMLSPVLLGRSRSRGKGWAHFTLKEYVADENSELPNDLPDDQFVVHCLTPTIVLDEWLRPSSKLFVALDDEPELIAAETSHARIAGWSSIHNLPKPEDVAIDIGSVFRYRKTKELQGKESFKAFCQGLHSNGLGERRAEGFGQVRINDNLVFHPEII